MTDLALIRELDRLYLEAVETDTDEAWAAYFRALARADERFGLTEDAA